MPVAKAAIAKRASFIKSNITLKPSPSGPKSSPIEFSKTISQVGEA